MSSSRILMLEDDPQSLAHCRKILTDLDFEIYVTSDVKTAKKLFAQAEMNLVLIHVAKVPSTGLEFCHWIREQSVVPIVMLTDRHEKVTEHMALEAGADDYAVRPVSQKILMARVTQQLQRSKMKNEPKHELLRWENLTLDLLTHAFTYDHEIIPITATEFLILSTFLKEPQRVFTRDQLLRAAGLPDGPGSEHIINSHLSRLRIKIRKVSGEDYFSVVRGAGFRFVDISKVTSTHKDSKSRKIRLVK